MKKYIYAFILALFVLTACGSSDSSMDTAESIEMDMAVEDSVSSNESLAISDGGNIEMKGTNHKIIYSGSVSIETEDFDQTMTDLSSYVEELEGYIERSESYGSKANHNRVASYTFRIPKDEFFIFVNHIGSMGNVIRENTDSENVTDQYFDLESRLKTFRIREERLQDYMSKATEIEDMITLEREIQQVTAEIESLTGTLRRYDNLIDLSTVTVDIYEVKVVDIEIEGRTPLGKEIREVFATSTNALITIVRGLILVFVGLIPFAIPIGAIVGIVLLVYKLVNRKKK